MNPILNHEELYQQGNFNLAKKADHSGALVGSSTISNAAVNNSERVSGGGEKLEAENEDAVLWADLFSDHFREDRLPPLVKISLLELLQINSASDHTVPTKP